MTKRAHTNEKINFILVLEMKLPMIMISANPRASWKNKKTIVVMIESTGVILLNHWGYFTKKYLMIKCLESVKITICTNEIKNPATTILILIVRKKKAIQSAKISISMKIEPV